MLLSFAVYSHFNWDVLFFIFTKDFDLSVIRTLCVCVFIAKRFAAAFFFPFLLCAFDIYKCGIFGLFPSFQNPFSNPLRRQAKHRSAKKIESRMYVSSSLARRERFFFINFYFRLNECWRLIYFSCIFDASLGIPNSNWCWHIQSKGETKNDRMKAKSKELVWKVRKCDRSTSMKIRIKIAFRNERMKANISQSIVFVVEHTNRTITEISNYGCQSERNEEEIERRRRTTVVQKERNEYMTKEQRCRR